MAQTRDPIEQLVEAVREHEELYAKSHRLYFDSKHKEKLWKSFSTRFKFDAKKKWTYLRDKYQRLKNSYSSSGSATKGIPEWRYYNCLTFLNDYLQPRTMTENEPTIKEEASKSITGIDLFHEDNVFTSAMLPKTDSSRNRPALPRTSQDDSASNSASWDAGTVPVTSRDTCGSSSRDGGATAKTLARKSVGARSKRKNKDVLAEEVLHILSNVECALSPNGQEDSDILFLKSFGKQMKAMNKQQKKKFKIGLINLADECLEED